MIDIVLIFILLMGFLIGKKIGFLKSVYVFVSFFASFISVKFFTPMIMPILVKTNYYGDMVNKFKELINVEDVVDDMSTSVQSELLSEYSIFEPIISSVIKNNNIDMYEAFNIDTAVEYVANAFAYTLTYLGACIVVFILTSFILMIFGALLKIFSKLPIISTINALLGGIIGLFNTSVLLWLSALIINVFRFGDFVVQFNTIVNDSYIAKYFFNASFFINIINNIK